MTPAMRPARRRGRHALAAALAALALAAPALCAAPLDEARAAVERRQFDTALPLYRVLLAEQPGHADLLIEAARVSGFADRNAEAAARYRQVLVLAPQRRADVLPSLAWQTLWAGDAAAAVPLFEELGSGGADRADRVDRASAFDGLGQARLALGDDAAAITAWRAALALQPAQPGVERRLARALMWSDRHDEAAALLQAALERNPADRDSAWLLAHVRNFAGLHFLALGDFRRLGGPRGAGEATDLARAWAWAGFEDRAHALLAGQGGLDPDITRWRDTRLARPLRPQLNAALEHEVDSDSLEAWRSSLAALWQPAAGQSAELRLRRSDLVDGNGAPSATELEGQWRLRLGEPGAGTGPDGLPGVLWTGFGLRLSDWGDWTPVTGQARLTWLPRDRWRLDAEAGRSLVETPQAIAERVSVDSLALGMDHRPQPGLTLSLGLAALRFDEGNLRRRVNARVEWRLPHHPRWSVGADAMAFESTRPTGPGVAARGYWNPQRYGEARVFGAWRIERADWDAGVRLGLGRSSERDGDGLRSRGRPNFWELNAGWDPGASARWQFVLGGSGGGFGVSQGGAGYWRRYAGLSFSGWF